MPGQRAAADGRRARALRSMRAVLPGSGDAGAQRRGVARRRRRVRNWTSVSPSAGDRRDRAGLARSPRSCRRRSRCGTRSRRRPTGRRSSPTRSATPRRRSARPCRRRSPSGAPGAVRSMRTVLVGPGLAGVQAEPLPSSVDGAELHQRLALRGDGQRRRRRSRPTRSRRRRPRSGTRTRRSRPWRPSSRRPRRSPMRRSAMPASRRSRSERSGRCGRSAPCWSASGAAGAQAETLPAPSMLRSCTSVSPSAVTMADAPAVGASQVTPPSVDVRYW